MSTRDTEPETTLESESGTAATAGGLDANVAGALAYLFGFVTGLIFYLIEKEDEFVRFHAAQSMVVFGGIVVLAILTSILQTVLFVGDAFFTGGIVAVLLSLVLGLVWLVVSLGAFLLWIFLMISAYQGKRTRVPVAAKFADRLV